MSETTRKIILSLLICVSLFLVPVGCKRAQEEALPSETGRCNAFTGTEISLQVNGKSVMEARYVTATEEHFVFIAGDIATPDLIWTDKTGNIAATYKVTGFGAQTLCATADTVFAVGPDEFGGWKAREYGLSGAVGEEIEFNVQYIVDAVYIGDTWAFIYPGGRVELFRNGESVYTRKGYQDEMLDCTLTVQNNKIVWLSWNQNQEGEWVVLDPDTLSEEIIPIGSKSFNFPGIQCDSSFGFFYEDVYKGISRYNPSSSTIETFMSAQDTDIPPSRYVYTMNMLPFVTDEDHIIYLNNPVTHDPSDLDPAEVILLTRLEKNPHEGKTVLTLGGWGVTSAREIQTGVYRFNISNSEYRIHLREYTVEYLVENGESFDRILATLISDLSSGKGDDILYEEMFFNFSVMGRNGALVDMMPYLENDPDLSSEAWLPSIFELMKTDDSLYRFFTGFTFYGYVGNASFLSASDSFSAQRLTELSDTLAPGVTMFPGVSAENLFINAILYGMEDYIDANGTFYISPEQTQDLLDYALTCGIPGGSDVGYGQDQYAREKQVLFYSAIGNAQMYNQIERMIPGETLFIGSPTLTDTARICSPGTSVAISDATEHPEACWEFVKSLMLPEVQQSIIEIGYFPVGKDAFESFMDQAIHPELRTAAEDTGLDTYDKSAVPEDCVERLKGIVDSLNTTDEVDYLLSQIILEECLPALHGEKSAKDTAEVLNDRVNIYLQSY